MTGGSRTRVVFVAAAVALVAAACTGLGWGSDAHGQLGDGTAGGFRTLPIQESSASDWRVLEAGQYHTCGIKQDSTLWCWGNNTSGQLGDGTTTSTATPTRVGTASDWGSVAPGYRFTCGIRAGGKVWCWGRNSIGELGDGTATDSSVPVRVGTLGGWTRLTAGARHACAIRDGDIYCWGNNSTGQLGVGDTTHRYSPTAVAMSPWRLVDAGDHHTCGITVSDQAFCWGRDQRGQLGDGVGTAIDVDEPQAIFASTLPWRTLSAGGDNTCAIVDLDAGIGSDNVYCWGYGGWGQLGNGLTNGDDHHGPQNVAVGYRTIEVSHGEHVCAIVRDDGSLECWGRNDEGQLGLGDTTTRYAPETVSTDSWSGVSGGEDHTVGLRSDD